MTGKVAMGGEGTGVYDEALEDARTMVSAKKDRMERALDSALAAGADNANPSNVRRVDSLDKRIKRLNRVLGSDELLAGYVGRMAKFSSDFAPIAAALKSSDDPQDGAVVDQPKELEEGEVPAGLRKHQEEKASSGAPNAADADDDNRKPDADGDGIPDYAEKKQNESKIQTPEQEKTLYESRFAARNNRLFENLTKKWTK